MDHSQSGAEPWRAWSERVEKALAGAPYDSLRSRIDDGRTPEAMALEPIEPPAEPVFAGRPYAGPWQIVQRVDADESAASAAREDLENGANALSLVFAGAPSAHGRGLTVADLDGLDGALEGIHLDLVPLHLEAGARGHEAFALVAALAERRATLPQALHAGIDPFGACVASGLARDASATAERLAEAIAAFRETGLTGTPLAADARVAAEAGASPVQELAYALVVLKAQLEALEEGDVPASAAVPMIALRLSASHDQFATIAKLRAARRLHRLFAGTLGFDGPATLHVTTLSRMLALSDPHTNMLRLTLAAFSAVTGGADALTVLPFDADGNRFARRMARNTQTLLLEEAHIARLADPGAGSGTIESYTDGLARAAWSLFQEHADAPFAALLSGSHALVRKIAQRPLDDAGRTIVGVTKYVPQDAAPAAKKPPAEPVQTRRVAVSGDRFADLVGAAREGATLADLAVALGDFTHRGSAPLAPTLAPAHAGG